MGRPRKEQEANTGDVFTVVKAFRDAHTFVSDGKTPKRYEFGDDVSYFDEHRLKELVKRGLVKMDTRQGSMVEQPTLEPPTEE